MPLSISGQLAAKTTELVRLVISTVEHSSEHFICLAHFSWRNGYYS
ncbi:hypothetical protein VCRA2113O118_70027 [Vibrio crassostreae]|uniref:Uncharacterized protein n=1 Tax=Vibrio crassostreae TaxID=246167 RepID=A0A822MZW5_9VIBR|nr:hypothetical protein VCRA2113O118_70027 [Vibrio crassostreae]CAK3411295.1 hypothetical protein VCRA2123E76_20027 [Vibrio crassostreae]CAK3679399.1 hypothetical protein VCRA2121O127_70078 [Vibrio crassostreae]CAK3679586.1 hypothetical protein VCRA2128O108_50037 [Vibrio crassostreae]CAK3716439.1 hypothetical protein VCRA2126O133_80029 [Vibrio crassostreae]